MSHEPAAAAEHKPHVLPIKIYLGVWISLMILTYVTVKISYQDFGLFNIIVAMGVATIKASLVVMFFMHLKYDEGFNKVVFLGSLAFLGVFFVLTLADTAERGKVDPLEAKELVPVPARPELWQKPAGEAGEAGEHGAADEPGEAGGESHDAPAEGAPAPDAHGETAAPGEGGNPGETPPPQKDASSTEDSGGH